MGTPQTTSINQELPPDVQQYLYQAFIEVISEKQFQPTSNEAMTVWFNENFTEVITRASELQAKMVTSVINNDHVKKAVGSALSAQVWGDIRIQQFKLETQCRVNKAIHEALNMPSHLSHG